jgi:hypothetical protein
MAKRRPVSATTIEAVAAEMAGHPLDAARAASYAAAYEPVLTAMDMLRRLPLKTIEPACVFSPEGAPDRG